MFVIPAKGRKVPDPFRGDYLPERGRNVPKTSYWLRRLLAGDVKEKTCKKGA